MLCVLLHSNLFLLTVIWQGCRAIGLSDRKNLYLEQGSPYFPDDFPDTASCALQAQYSAQALAAKHSRTPKSKRVNYEANRISSPFQPDWSQIIDCKNLEVCSENASELAVVDKDSFRPDILVVRETIDPGHLEKFK